MVHAFDLSAGVFIRGLNNLKALLAKAEAQALARGSDATALLAARLADMSPNGSVAYPPRDVHAYTLADQAHWAAEGARLAIERLRGGDSVPAASEGTSFAALNERIDRTIAALKLVSESALASGLERQVRIEHPRGTVECSGSQFLLAYAIPHFLYHVSAVYGILRNQGIHLTMGDFLGDWGAN